MNTSWSTIIHFTKSKMMLFFLSDRYLFTLAAIKRVKERITIGGAED
jgi:hypothetical protein